MNPIERKPTSEDLIFEMHTKITQIHTALYGIPGTEEKGMCGKVTQLEIKQGKLRANFRTLLFVLIGSGVLVGGGVGIDKLIALFT